MSDDIAIEKGGAKSTSSKLPHALLRIGFPYERTVGMRRLTNTATDVAVTRDGTLLVLCRGEGLTFIRRLTIEDDDLGAFNLVGGGGPVGGPEKATLGFVWPAAMVLDDEENLWITDEGNHTVSAITQKGELLSRWGTAGSGPGELNRPSGLCLADDDAMYVCDTLNHRVQKLTRSGGFLLQWGRHGTADAEFDMPWGIGRDPDGNVYVSDWRNDRVQKFTSDGQHLGTIGRPGAGDGELNRPAGITVDADGDLYVADWGNNRVQLFDRNGRFVEKFVGDSALSRQAREYMISNLMALRLREMTPVEPQKRLRWPTSVRTDSTGLLYIADYGSHRVQIYRKNAHRINEDQIASIPRSRTLYTQF